MKRETQALCYRCGRIWVALTKAILAQEEKCRDCKIPALIRFNPPIGKI